MIEPAGATTIPFDSTKEGIDYIRSISNISTNHRYATNKIAAIAKAQNNITCNVFDLLERAGFRTHYLGRIDEMNFSTKKVNVIPLKFTVSRIATNAYTKRYPETANGTVFKDLVCDITEVSGDYCGSSVVFQFCTDTLFHYDSNNTKIAEEFISCSDHANMRYSKLAELVSRSEEIFKVLEDRWRQLNVTLIYLEIEFGVDTLTGETIVCGRIDNNSWRVRLENGIVNKPPRTDGAKTLADISVDLRLISHLTDKFDSF